MKKALLGTTALIAGGLMAGSVMAADLEPAPLPAPVDEGWEVVVGGFANTGVYYNKSNIVGLADDMFVFWDSEIHFTASTTLANGIRIAVRVELEGFQSGDQIDEHFMSISGNFGRFEIGANDSAVNAMTIGAPGYGYNGLNGSTFDAQLGQNAAAGDYNSWTGDSNKVTYYTPRISGFQAGVSFTPNNNVAGGTGLAARRPNANQKHIFSAAANYNNTFNDVSVAFGAGVESGKSASNAATGGKRTEWNVGARIGMAGFTIGGNYSRMKRTPTAIAAVKGRVWMVGASYGTGPWTVGAGYLASKLTGNNKFQRFGGGATYALGTGVSLTADFNRETRKNAGVKRKGFVTGVAIRTSF